VTSISSSIADPTERGNAVELGQWLRGLRNRRGLSLQGVEEASAGRWKGVVVGSYERGDRAITVAKLVELCRFYGWNPADYFAAAADLPAVRWTGNDRYASAGRLLVDAIRTLPDLSALAGDPR
jgi:transcriptional regulator with XRE-family HTH domain